MEGEGAGAWMVMIRDHLLGERGDEKEEERRQEFNCALFTTPWGIQLAEMGGGCYEWQRQRE